jgi:tetratricopeptide (TPR) repeat protein
MDRELGKGDWKMNQLNRVRRFSASGMMALLLLSAGSAAAQVPGWDPRWPDLARVLAGCPPQDVRGFREQSALIAKDPNDEGALVNRGVYAHRLAKTSRLDMYLDWLAAKDLEKAIKLDPKDFTAWHNYGDLNYDSGDMWAINDHSNRRRALWAFDHAIALNPKSARSYLGRGWTYYELNDVPHANADFQKALQLDPSLRANMQKEIANIKERHRQEDAARGTVSQMARYYVLKTARNESECAEGKGSWVITTSKDGHITSGECHISMALYPGPTQSWEGK